MARFKLHRGQVCVAHRHVGLITALVRGSASAAAEMRKHLQELEQSLAGAPTTRRSLRDAFTTYREAPTNAPATDSATRVLPTRSTPINAAP